MAGASTASPASTPGSLAAIPASSSWPTGTASPVHLARKITDEIAGLPGPAQAAPIPGCTPVALAGTHRDTLARMQVSADGNRLLAEHAGLTRTMIPVGAASFIDENDPDIRLHAHAADGNPDAITIEFPFTWFTGYKILEDDRT